MTTFKTPGVYVEEISTFPPSVAEVETAIPAFFGFTEKGTPMTPKRIVSLKEFEDSFGFADIEKGFSVSLFEEPMSIDRAKEFKYSVKSVTVDKKKVSENVLYYAMKLFFANGGGPCFITSTGFFTDSNSANVDTYLSALNKIGDEDEPTLLVFPDAPFVLKKADNYYDLISSCLEQCVKLGDRFCIVDVVDMDIKDNPVIKFRSIGFAKDANHAKYAAAYYPYLNTNISYQIKNKIEDKDIVVSVFKDNTTSNEASKKLIKAQLELEKANAALEKVKIDTSTIDVTSKSEVDDAKKKIDDATKVVTASEKSVSEAEKELNTSETTGGKKVEFSVLPDLTQKQILQKIGELGVTLTPCAAIAGVYASVDSSRGVWKAPANISLNYVKSTTLKITDEDQRDLNVDENAGKSINAIRAFTGQGIKVWGARTLDGNDNEWRYINVRRFFNMVEESVKKSTNWAVFEPNDSNTWVKVRAMIENFLFVKWRDGAMAGTKPSDAFYVRVGLGQTMTAQDILEGRMYIEIGMAVVRPAEFIILRFSHKLQVS